MFFLANSVDPFSATFLPVHPKVPIYGFPVSNGLRLAFFQVSKYFSEIFKKLAPEGHAVLVMKKGDQDQGVCRSGEQSALLRSFNIAKLKFTYLPPKIASRQYFKLCC